MAEFKSKAEAPDPLPEILPAGTVVMPYMTAERFLLLSASEPRRDTGWTLLPDSTKSADNGDPNFGCFGIHADMVDWSTVPVEPAKFSSGMSVRRNFSEAPDHGSIGTLHGPSGGAHTWVVIREDGTRVNWAEQYMVPVIAYPASAAPAQIATKQWVDEVKASHRLPDGMVFGVDPGSERGSRGVVATMRGGKVIDVEFPEVEGVPLVCESSDPYKAHAAKLKLESVVEHTVAFATQDKPGQAEARARLAALEKREAPRVNRAELKELSRKHPWECDDYV